MAKKLIGIYVDETVIKLLNMMNINKSDIFLEVAMIKINAKQGTLLKDIKSIENAYQNLIASEWKQNQDMLLLKERIEQKEYAEIETKKARAKQSTDMIALIPKFCQDEGIDESDYMMWMRGESSVKEYRFEDEKLKKRFESLNLPTDLNVLCEGLVREVICA